MDIKLTKGNEPLYIQLYNCIADAVEHGYIQNRTKLPSRRKMAEDLDIAEITVDAAYAMLQDTGYVTIIPRQGCFVSFKAPENNGDIPWDTASGERYIFTPNGIDKTMFPRADYAKIVKNILYNDGFDILSHPQKNGEFVLRNAISKYLYSFRDIKCSPHQVIVGAGQEYLITSFFSVFDDDIIFAMEDSGYSRSYYAFTSYNRKIKTIPTGMNGLNIDDLYSSGAKVFYAAPYHHFPTGHKMTRRQKEQLIEWVSESPDRYIIEDCFDCEINWESSESLFSMDKNNRVVLLNSFSRSICSSFRISYMVIPDPLLSLWRKKHRYYYSLVPQLDQYALAEFIDKGHFVKHYKKMRKLYKERREILKASLINTFKDKVRISENSDNVCVIITLKIGIPENEIILKARNAGVRIFLIKNHCIDSILMPDCTFILGIGELTGSQIKEAVRELYNALLVPGQQT